MKRKDTWKEELQETAMNILTSAFAIGLGCLVAFVMAAVLVLIGAALMQAVGMILLG